MKQSSQNNNKQEDYKINTSFSNNQNNLWKHIENKLLPMHFSILDNIQNCLTINKKRLFLKTTEIESKVKISTIDNNDIDTVLELTSNTVTLVNSYMYMNALTVMLHVIKITVDEIAIECENSYNKTSSNFNNLKLNLINNCENYITELKFARSQFKTKTIDESKINNLTENIYDNNQEIRLDIITDEMDKLASQTQDILSIVKESKKIEELIELKRNK